jgi:N-acetyltransferase 10
MKFPGSFLQVIQEQNGDFGRVVTRINIFKEHRQTIQYILPSDSAKLAQAELLAIDEAAAIPLPTIKSLLGPYLVFLSSTVNGYEGTGRSLSLKLIQQLRQQQGLAAAKAAQQAGDAVHGSKSKKGERHLHEDRWKVASEAAAKFASAGVGGLGDNSIRSLKELTLETPIRYHNGDPIERWLNNLLCLDAAANSTRMVSHMPAPKDCEVCEIILQSLYPSINDEININM